MVFPTVGGVPVAFLVDVPFRARVQCFVLRSVFDLQLAAGSDPRSSAAIGLRAAQLCRVRTRRRIAMRLRRTITAARESPDDRWGYAPLARGEVLAEADALMDLADRLEDVRPVEPMGVALAKLIATGPDSPLAVGAEPGTMRTVVRLATVALDVSPSGWRARDT
jgi:hypothetical protein